MPFDPKILPGRVLANQELCGIFKCAPQGGMRRSIRTNTLVIVSDHTRGVYEDKWIDSKLHYTGMGLHGDQSLVSNQNRTLAKENSNGVGIHLFEVFDAGRYLYHGRVKLAGKPYQEQQRDKRGSLRNVWIFPLDLIDTKEPVSIPEEEFKKYQEKKEKQARQLSDQELDERIKATSGKASRRVVTANQYQGNPDIKEKAKRLAKGKCNLCGQNAPFLDKNNRPYLDGHHIIWLSKGGPDVLTNVVALCPNCHKKMHVLDLKSDQERLKEYTRNRK